MFCLWIMILFQKRKMENHNTTCIGSSIYDMTFASFRCNFFNKLNFGATRSSLIFLVPSQYLTHLIILISFNLIVHVFETFLDFHCYKHYFTLFYKTDKFLNLLGIRKTNQHEQETRTTLNQNQK